MAADKRARSTTLLIGTTGALIAILVSGCGGEAQSATPTESPKPDIVKARISCNLEGEQYAKLGDGGYTITLQGNPKYQSDRLAASDIACVLDAINTPDRVIERMDSTRAMDGMQEAEWDNYSASWTYHPDDGAKIILSQSK